MSTVAFLSYRNPLTIENPFFSRQTPFSFSSLFPPFFSLKARRRESFLFPARLPVSVPHLAAICSSVYGYIFHSLWRFARALFFSFPQDAPLLLFPLLLKGLDIQIRFLPLDLISVFPDRDALFITAGSPEDTPTSPSSSCKTFVKTSIRDLLDAAGLPRPTPTTWQAFYPFWTR